MNTATKPLVHSYSDSTGKTVHTTKMTVFASDDDAETMREYRWSVEAISDGRTRAVAEYFRPGHGWRVVVNPDRCKQLLGMTPVLAA